MRLDGHRIIVTGGASGIGATLVQAFVHEGAQVGSLDVAVAAGQAVALTAANEGPGCARFIACDVASRDACLGAFAEAAAVMGGLDSLVHVAGVERAAPAAEIDDAHWDLMMDVNARSTMLINQAAFPYLAIGGGQIVNFASVAGVLGLRNGAAYSAAKAAVLGWTRAVAQEWAGHGITVNAIAPSMWTPMYDEHRARLNGEELAAHDAYMAGIVPIGGKLGDPARDIAPVLVFLVSGGARFMTGQTFPIDGGRLTMR